MSKFFLVLTIFTLVTSVKGENMNEFNVKYKLINDDEVSSLFFKEERNNGNLTNLGERKKNSYVFGYVQIADKANFPRAMIEIEFHDKAVRSKYVKSRLGWIGVSKKMFFLFRLWDGCDASSVGYKINVLMKK